MIGLGGWGGRNEKNGPYIRIKDGKVVRDESKGPGGSHGRQHAFLIEHLDTDHPITKGLPSKWMHAQDELYDRLRGPAKNLNVLAFARAAKETGGSGENEPLLMTVDYGKGRVFHTALGHGVEAMKCVGFIVTLQRGTEWAATGKVTLNEVPADFPTAEKTSSRK
jgi:type 1 glutamine amidotransferase